MTLSGVEPMTWIRLSTEVTTTGRDTGPDPGTTLLTSTVAVNVEVIGTAPDGEK